MSGLVFRVFGSRLPPTIVPNTRFIHPEIGTFQGHRPFGRIRFPDCHSFVRVVHSARKETR